MASAASSPGGCGAETVLDLSQTLVYVALVSSVISLATTVWALLTSGARKNAERIAVLDDRLSQAEKALQRLEDRLAELPRREMLHSLELTLARMEGQMATLDERLRPVAAIAERMQELLIHQARRDAPGGR
jgi:chromosome segregation ATPase